MNPTQMTCAWDSEHELPKVGGVEVRVHKSNGKDSRYFDQPMCAIMWLADQYNLDIVDGDTLSDLD